ncbi:MAG: signal peptide peptidase SppA [Rhodospirillales bacterium]
MSSETDRLLDRRRLKRRLTVWRVLAVLAVAVAGIAFYGRFDGVVKTGPYVATVAIDGLILRDDERSEAIRAVADDEDAVALIVEIDSPGGGFVASEGLFQDIRRVNDAGKPVVAIIGNTGASGGYMAALGAERIYASAGSVTGSIGVIMETANIIGLLESIGIKPEVVKSGPLKAQPNPVEPFTPEARENIQGVIDDLHQAFVDILAQRRDLSKSEALDLADGRIFTGRQAHAAGLVDGIGGMEEARAWLDASREIDKGLRTRDVTPVDEVDRLRDIMGGALGKALFSERLTLDGVLALWHPQLEF